MELPAKFKIYRAACIALLLSMAVSLLLLLWLIAKDPVGLNANILLVAAFFFIYFKNARLGLTLFDKLGQQLPIQKKLRTTLKIYWALQLAVQVFVAFYIWNTLILLYSIAKIGTIEGYPKTVLLSDLSGLFIFLSATVCLILLWPFVRYVRLQYHAQQQAKRKDSEHILAGFE